MKSRLNAYRVMWLMVLYDLPMESERQKRNYRIFRKKMMKDGFGMFQFSAYLRHCMSKEQADVHISRVQRNLPPEGRVGVIQITDKQFGRILLFSGRREAEKAPVPQQLELF